MIRFVLLFSQLLLLTSCASVTPVSPDKPVERMMIGGVLTTDTQLAGDYLLETDLQVPPGITLTMLPGSSILVVPSDSTKIDPEYLSKEVEILVRGRLLVRGTLDQPVRIFSATAGPAQIAWAGLEFVASADSELQHLIIEQAETAVLCLDSSPRLDSVQILRSRYGIMLQQNSHPQISDSQLRDGEAGVFCWDQSSLQLERTALTDHQQEAIYLGRDCRADLRENLIKNNDRGIVLPDGVAIGRSNLIFDNRQNMQTYPAEVKP